MSEFEGPIETAPGSEILTQEDALAERVRRQGLRRFIWSADPHGRFTAVSAPLAEVVGEANANVVGRSWREIADGIVLDERGAVAEALARRSTWSNETVLWRVAGSDLIVPVELGGMPVFGRGHELEGHRGFGLCRAGEVRPAPDAHPEEVVSAVPVEGAPAAPVEGQTRPGVVQITRVPDEEAVEDIADDGPPAAEVSEEMAFGPLQARVGAQLGTARPLPLRSTRDTFSSVRPAGSDATGSGGESSARPILSTSEMGALQELARALGARIEQDEAGEAGEPVSADIVAIPGNGPARDPDTVRILDRLPIGVLVLRGEMPLFVNRFALDVLGYDSLSALVAAGGVSRLFAGQFRSADPTDEGSTPTLLVTRSGLPLEAEVRFTTVEWGEAPASFVMIRPTKARLAAEPAKRPFSANPGTYGARLLGWAGVATAIIDGTGRVLAFGEADGLLFGKAADELVGTDVTSLFVAGSHPSLIDLLAELRSAEPGRATGERRLSVRGRDEEVHPVFVRGGRLEEGGDPRSGLLIRSAASDAAAEVESTNARRDAEDAAARMGEVLARVSHEIRTPLNAIIGFAEIMEEERFGPVGSERYRGYLKDIRESGRHVVSLVNDLLDLAKVSAGRHELAPAALDLGAVAGGAVAMLQPAASQARIIIRASFNPGLPRIFADERSVRQIVINLLSNAVRFTESGGQVIVTTGLTDRGEITLRVRDTGIGMSADEVRSALEPFRQVTVAGRRDGTGLGLPLSKALADANGASLSIRSEQGRGTLVEVIFPAA